MVVTGDRPNISSYTVWDERTADDLVDLDKFGFKMAFAVERIIEEGTYLEVHDPNFVEFVAFIYDSERKGNKYEYLTLHKCDEEDYAEFHEIVKY